MDMFVSAEFHWHLRRPQFLLFLTYGSLSDIPTVCRILEEQKNNGVWGHGDRGSVTQQPCRRDHGKMEEEHCKIGP